MRDVKARQGHLLLWIFAVSGFSGLIYQSIWTRYLGLFLGHSAYAQSLVLMLFMGGMALGAWLVSRRSELLRRPLLAYALIELVIGVLGLLFDTLYQASTAWAYGNLMQTGGGSGLRWAAAALLVLPQCILLGATFPLMSAGFMRLQPAAEGRILAGLYFSNSIGAAIGALAATYLLVPWVGLPGTVMAAGLFNVLVALAVYPLSKAEAETSAPATATTRGLGSTTPVLVLAIAGLTGAASFVYEITWIRMLSLALGTTVHAFELMLAAFISGIAFGGLWLRHRADRLPSPLATAGWVQIWMGLAALASMFVYANAFEWVGWLMSVIARTSDGYGLYNLATGLISLLVMFPAAFFAGMTLPLLTLALLRQGGGERVIGHVYAVNTLGAIVGVLVAVHVLLPMVGVKLALWIAAAVDLSLGLVLLWVTREKQADRFRLPAIPSAVALSVAGLAVSMWLVKFDPLVLTSSVYRHGVAYLEGARMLYYRDGKTATVAVYEQGEGVDAQRGIATNGKVDAGLPVDTRATPGDDEFTMVLAAALPLSMRERFDRVGVIGFGSGLTTHTLLGSERVGQVDTVEIEPAMLEGARLFEGRVSRAYDDPRSHIVIDDAKSYFSSAAHHYDLIISEPSNPWMGGTASLFSDEFYAFVPRHLSKDGLFVQWLQLYEIDSILVSSVLRAMLEHFGDVQAYLANGSDLLLIASVDGRVPRAGSHLFNDEALKDELARLGIRNPRDLQDGFVMDHRALTAFAIANPAQANSDFFPVLQLGAPAARFMKRSVDLGPWHAAPWPITNHLGDITPRTVNQGPPGLKRPLAVDAKQKAARDLRNMIVEGTVGPSTHAEVKAWHAAEALRSLGSRCGLDAAPARHADLIFSIAAETVPYLDPPSLEGLWYERAWLTCEPSNPFLRDAIGLVEAAARDDQEQVIVQARRLLDGESARLVTGSAGSSSYVAGAMMFAALKLERPELAGELHDLYWERLHPTTRENGVIRVLLTLATMPPPRDETRPRD